MVEDHAAALERMLDLATPWCLHVAAWSSSAVPRSGNKGTDDMDASFMRCSSMSAASMHLRWGEPKLRARITGHVNFSRAHKHQA